VPRAKEPDTHSFFRGHGAPSAGSNTLLQGPLKNTTGKESTTMRTGNRLLVLAGLLVSVTVAATADAAQYIHKGFTVSALQEVPSGGGRTGGGSGVITIDTNTNILHYDFSYSGMSGTENNAHIHGPAARGVNAGVLVGLPAGSPKVGDWNYLEAQEANILGGLTYVNIHSTTFTGGEIRGQIEPILVSEAPSVGTWGIVLLSLLLVGTGVAFVARRPRMVA
jgi:hypothetical protein